MSDHRARVFDLPHLRDRTRVFTGRTEAGGVLAEMLVPLAKNAPLVLAIPAGGAAVGAVVANELNRPLDLAVVSKITLPWNTESGYGAVAWDGSVLLNEPLLGNLRLSPSDVQEGIERTRRKVQQRSQALRGGRPMPDLAGKVALLVDDGLASGITMTLAVQCCRRAGSAGVVVAVPTAHTDAASALAREADAVYVANLRSGPSFAVADAYRRWYDVSDEEVLDILARQRDRQARTIATRPG